MSSVHEYINGTFPVDGRYFSDLTQEEKENFLKYEVAIIDLDLPQDDPTIIEIFKRLNRTFYALSAIEKLSTEYGSSEYMLVAKMLCGELQNDVDETPAMKIKNVAPELKREDPNISEDFFEWGNKQKIDAFLELILESPIFTKYEIQRQVHLAYTLNLMSTIVFENFYNRNDRIEPYLDEYSEQFELKDNVVARLNNAANIFNNFRFAANSAWYSKSNAFSLTVALDLYSDGIAKASKKGLRDLKDELVGFLEAQPEDYALAAREAVNNTKQRILRHNAIAVIIERYL